MQAAEPWPTYGRPTRLVHGVLALAVITQLISSAIMDADEGGDAIFEVHEISGLTATAMVTVFWLTVLFRRRGTPLGQMVPWFSAARLRLLRADVMAHVRTAPKLRFPARDAASNDAFASAVHGLGLLLITTMAASGFLYYLVGDGDPDAGGLVAVAIFVHTLLANLAWAYLIGHAAMAFLHAYLGHSLRRMWSISASE